MELLPIIIIRKIISYLNLFEDRLIVSLLCKRLFTIRDKYINLFDTNIINEFNVNKTHFTIHLLSLDKGNQVDTIIHQLNSMSNLREVELSMGEGPEIWDQPLLNPSHPLCTALVDLVKTRAVQLCWKTYSIESSLKHLPLTSLIVSDYYPSRGDLLPSTLKHLIVKETYVIKHEPSGSLPLPDDLHTLDLTLATNSHFSQKELTPGMLPRQLQTLLMGRDMFSDGILPNTLPATLRSIRFGPSFNQPINQSVLPSSITSVDFYQNTVYGKDLVDLPSSLTSISLPHYYEDTLDHPQLQRLRIYSKMPKFSRPFPNMKRLRIEILERLSQYDRSFFPVLECLRIDFRKDKADTTLEGVITPNLTRCRLFSKAMFGLTFLVKELDHIASGVHSLKLGRCSFKPGFVFPSSITSLTLWYVRQVKISELPPSITSLELRLNTWKMEAPPPPTVRHLTLYFNAGVEEYLDNIPLSNMVLVIIMNRPIMYLKFIRLADQLFLKCPIPVPESGGIMSLNDFDSLTNQGLH
ncbi:hypothetical protein SAMD00019534_049360 [Acytostelium subglobosum LB1]|uniref:hypothetical protein n=1 Tax=Acytostelium subglobosum LB1 TaxID=1410327 RepID=UPI00064506BF|nr:hypothetical protein SAMD00019534_049360 [Acytostelium subglobosum LB1]GAM21761.1 hypothetical protein SAMD00019534_049360 [Acytostelium subglobosum LB1]|eukprot:XP_012754861.1 hypothetical protein SAMD00019534_049360 [Acytostelium subglobosum LB1]